MNRVLTTARRALDFAPVLLLAYTALLFTVTHLPPTAIPSSVAGSDKHWHFFAYCGLGLLGSMTALPRTARWAGLTMLAVALFACLDELLQIPVGRSAEWLDWVADVSGAAVGIGLVLAASLVPLPERATPSSAA